MTYESFLLNEILEFKKGKLQFWSLFFLASIVNSILSKKYFNTFYSTICINILERKYLNFGVSQVEGIKIDFEIMTLFKFNISEH